MIDAVGLFLFKHVKAQIPRILLTTHPYLAGFLSFCVSFNIYGFGSHFSVDENFTLFQNYDTVIFGFTATAMAIMLTIASGKFLSFLSSIELEGRTAYRAAVFVLSWNSFVHLIAFMFIFIMKNSIFWQQNIATVGLETDRKILLFVALWFQFYSFFQFIVTTLTLFEIADLFGIFLQRFPD